MTDLALKYNLLDSSSRREVLDFMDFLLKRHIKSKKQSNANDKKKILKISVLTDANIG